jgi:hypothetical protein
MKPPIPGDLLIWEERVDWRVKIERVIPPGLRDLLTLGFRQRPPTQPYVDSLCWLDDYIPSQRLGDACDQVATALYGFRCRAYHACRPIDLQSYFDRGIVALRPASHSERLWALIQPMVV